MNASQGVLVGVTLVFVAFVASWLGTARFRRYALSRALLDIPNQRSSHVVAVPRGGGIVFSCACVGGCLLLTLLGCSDWRLFGALAVSGGAVAAVGFIDDHGHVAAGWRLIVHVLAAAIAIAFLFGGQFDHLPFAGTLGATAAFLLTLLVLVWLVNLYNFMDGIDGIAAVEAITVIACVTVVRAFALGGATQQWPAWILLASLAGFLVWNFPPARIFMGDVGSGFIGMALGVLGLASLREHPAMLWAWSVMLGVFVVDASLTLLRRALRGAPVLQAHRSHAFQRAALRFGSHRVVTVAVALINLCWLAPWTVAVVAGVVPGWQGMLFAYLPLLVTAAFLGAGGPEQREGVGAE